MIPVLSALLLAIPDSPWVDPAPTGRWAASTEKLASELLSPEMAVDVVSHEVTRPIVQGGQPFSVRFTGRRRPTGDGFCLRSTYYVHVGGLVERPDAGDPPVRGSDIRRGDCLTDEDAIFAHINSDGVSGAKQAVRWLEWAQGVARSPAALPFQLTCRTDVETERCADGGRKALAELPLDKIFIIARKWQAPPHHWKVAVTETRPGQRLWDVAINATPGNSTVDLDWKIPAPF